MEDSVELEYANSSVITEVFQRHEPFTVITVRELGIPSFYVSILTYIILGGAVLVSLAIVYHWLRYARNQLAGFLILALYTVGFFVLAGSFLMKGTLH